MVVSISHPPGAELCSDWATRHWGGEGGSEVSLALWRVCLCPGWAEPPAPAAPGLSTAKASAAALPEGLVRQESRGEGSNGNSSP